MLNMPLLERQLEQVAYPMLFASVSGAHLYGFPSPDSDYDIRGVHIVSLEEALGLRTPKENLQFNRMDEGVEIDFVSHDIRAFFLMLLRRDGNVLEQVLSPLHIHSTPEHEELKALTPACITRHHAHHYMGFAKHKWTEFEKAERPKVKPLLYVYRVLLTGLHLMGSGQVEPNLVTLNAIFKLPYIPELIERKLAGGEQGYLTAVDMELHAAEYARLLADLERAYEESHLPNNPTAHDALNDLLIRVRMQGA